MAERKVILREKWENELKVVDIRKEDMDNLVMNYLITECCDKAAENFIQESGTTLIFAGIDLEGVRARANIKRKILCGDIDDAMEDISPDKLVAFSVDVNFRVAQQFMIELIRVGAAENALNFAQDYFLDRPGNHPLVLEEIERTCALLAFEDPLNCPFGELMGTSQRLETAKAVNQEILICEDQERESKLYYLLRQLLLVQNQLNKEVAYPQINLSSGVLEDPVI